MIIGLTGGIGSGKSAAADFFQNEGVTVIDADDLAREVIEKNTLGYESIVDYFGSKINTLKKALNLFSMLSQGDY